jgi:hypothetical protein
VVKPLAGQTEQTWHSLACAVKTEGETVRVGAPNRKEDRFTISSMKGNNADFTAGA